jgi:hypothetical protein
MQKCGQRFGVVGLLGVAGQGLSHALHQQAVTAVLQHGQGQGVLQHLLQGLLVTPQGQAQVICIKNDSCLRLPEETDTAKEH